MFSIFPRQVAVFKRRYKVNNRQEMLALINKYNPFVKVWVSVYNYTANPAFDEDNLQVDKIFFDLESDETCFEDIKKMHNWALQHDYKHQMFFSGRRFHFYLKTKNFQNLLNKKEALKNVHLSIAKELKFVWGTQGKGNVDRAAKGNLAQVAGYPNTYNTKGQRYCIPISEYDLDQGMDYIRDKAKFQRFGFETYGKEEFDISKFDAPKLEDSVEAVAYNANGSIAIDLWEQVKKLPACIQTVFKKDGKWGNRGRYIVITHLRDKGFLQSEAKEILRNYMSAKEFQHCVDTEGQLADLYSLEKMKTTFFPSCKQLKKEGFCTIANYCGKEVYK